MSHTHTPISSLTFPSVFSFQEVALPIQLPRAEISIIRSTATSKQFLWPQLFNPFYFSFISHPIVIMDLPPVCVSRCSAPCLPMPDAGCKDTILYKCQFFLNITQHLNNSNQNPSRDYFGTAAAISKSSLENKIRKNCKKKKERKNCQEILK